MRSTITLDPDVVRLVQDAMHSGRRTFKDVINGALRAALGPGAHGATLPPYEVRPHEGGLRPEFRRSNPNSLASELEEEALVGKLLHRAGP